MDIFVAVGIGFLLDLILGDPQWLPHPIRFIGFLISHGEKLMRRVYGSIKAQVVGGILLTILIVSISFIIPLALLLAASYVSIYLKIAIEAIFCYQILAAKSLKVESMRVHYYLSLKDIESSRRYLSWIVGRDTENLNDQQIIKAAVETVAENTSDGVIAPLLFMVIGGAPLGFLYKAVNTLDSMIGYKNDKYLYFGRFAARLDDVMNFVPAIISAYLMIITSFLLKLNGKKAIKIYKRDKANHSSPNSGKTEAVCAGALDIQLGGDSFYFGKLVHKKTIGDANRSLEIEDIYIVNKLMYGSAFLSVLIFLTFRLLVVMIF